jgi:hypothetical protein
MNNKSSARERRWMDFRQSGERAVNQHTQHKTNSRSNRSDFCYKQGR